MSVMRSLTHDDRGVAAVEFALIAPIMVALLLGVATYFTVYRDDARAKRGTYTISDMIARQSSVDNAFLANIKEMFAKLAPKNGTAPGLRVTSVTKVGLIYTVDWSYATSPFERMTTLTIPTGKLPETASGQSTLIVETSTPYTPFFPGSGLTASRFENVSTVRPRYVAKIAKAN